MGEWKTSVTLRMRRDLRTEMIAFAEQEKRSLGGLAAILLEWSFEQLKAAGLNRNEGYTAGRSRVIAFKSRRRNGAGGGIGL